MTWLDELCEAHTRSGLTVAELSRRTGLSAPAINAILTGRVAQPRVGNFDKIVHALVGFESAEGKRLVELFERRYESGS